MTMVKDILNVFNLLENVKGVQLCETLDDNDKNNIGGYPYLQNEREFTLLLIVGQLLIELSRLPTTLRQSNRETIIQHLDKYEFNEYTLTTIKSLLMSIDHMPFMVREDYLDQLHHTTKQLRFTHHKFTPIENNTISSDTVCYFRTLIKQYLILSALLFNSKDFITSDNVSLIYEVLYSINNYANVDSIYFDDVPLTTHRHIDSVVTKRNEYMEFRFLADIMVKHIRTADLNLTQPYSETSCSDALTLLGVLDGNGDVRVRESLNAPLPTQQVVSEQIKLSSPESLYVGLETIARFMDWNPELVEDHTWLLRFNMFNVALLERLRIY